jgi:hypothetical protein
MDVYCRRNKLLNRNSNWEEGASEDNQTKGRNVRSGAIVLVKLRMLDTIAFAVLPNRKLR